MIERAVLHHHEDDVLDLRHRRRPFGQAWIRERAGPLHVRRTTRLTSPRRQAHPHDAGDGEPRAAGGLQDHPASNAAGVVHRAAW